jgi:hypothetical protein
MSSIARRFTGIAVTILLATAVIPLSTGSATAGLADGTSTNPARIGLYGQQTPRYDGVYRQGLTILALHDSGATVDTLAIKWLLRQQCDNGKWTSFRSDLSKPCGAADSNATAMAVMALSAIGRTGPATNGLNWLLDHQLDGGGWEYTSGWGPDSNSTGLVTQALIAMDVDPRTVTQNGTPLDFLASLQLRCHYDAAVRGALDYQAEVPLVANDYATAQASQALAGSALPVAPRNGSTELPKLPCGNGGDAVSRADAAAGYLGRRLAKNGNTIPNAFGGGVDYGSTANAVLSLVAAGYGANQVAGAMTELEQAVRSFTLDADGKVLPAAGALLVLAENATEGKPRDVDGLNLIKRLHRSMTQPADAPVVDTR